jgi:hypothetical protein
MKDAMEYSSIQNNKKEYMVIIYINILYEIRSGCTMRPAFG